MSQAMSPLRRSSSWLQDSDDNTLKRVNSGDRHHFMLQKFYTNNDRWSSSTAPKTASDGQQEQRRQQQVIKISQKQQRPYEHISSASTTATALQYTAIGDSPYHPSNQLVGMTHNNSPIIRNSSDNTSLLANKVTTTIGSALVAGNSTGNDYAKHMAGAGSNHDLNILHDECHTPRPLNFIHDCNSDSSQPLVLNIVTEGEYFSDYRDVWIVKSWQEILLRVSFVAPIVLVGLIGNLMIIYSMCKFKTIRSKPTNMFILNMALADLVTSIVCPNAALFTDIYQFYVLGSFMCRFEGAIKITCLLLSAYSLIVLSFDWFLCVVKPCRTRITIKQTWLTLVVIWIVSIAMSLPLLYFRRLRYRHWKDVDEVWCCEMIQYSKYYWVGLTLFLIYLPTFVMTIVLVVILAQMDKFEAKLKKSRQISQPTGSPTTSGPSNNTILATTPVTNTTTMATTAIATTATAAISKPTSGANSNGSLANVGRPTSRGQNNANGLLSINMKYKRRIVKILAFYLLTSILCWSPLQFVIVYRHFRSNAEFSGWFLELTFYSQLCATLSSALNPIIFGFLSQPFRRVVTKSWIFCFVNKVWASNARNRSDQGKNDNFAMDVRRINNNNNNNHHHINRNNMNYARSSQRITRDFEQPKLTIDYIEHEQQQLSGRVTTTGGGGGGGIGLTVDPSRRVSIISNSNQSHRNGVRHRQNIDSFNGSYSNCSRGSLVNQPNGQSHKQRPKIIRSHSSRDPQEGRNGAGVNDCNNNNNLNKRVSFNGSSQLATINTNGSTRLATGRENEAYVRDDGGDDDEAQAELGAYQGPT